MSEQQTPSDDIKHIAFVLYPGLTLLDMVGPLQTLVGLPAPYRATVVGARIEAMPSDTPLRVTPDATFEEVPHPFAIIVPGGTAGTIRAMADPDIQSYLRTASETAEVVGSVCTGAMVLAAAGLLEGRQATTHWAFAEQLNRLGATYQRKRWVEDGKFITAAGVSAGIDMALQLAGRLAGQEYAQRIQAVIEYDPEPPFGPMDWELAKPEFWWSRLGTPDEQKAWLIGLLEGRPDLQERLAR
jgi:transcriptional regulator GlxA family with amidase domain